jgi:hypothetical protein
LRSASNPHRARSKLTKFLAARFYFVMTLLTAAVVIIGFAPKLGPRLLHPPYPMPWSLYVHTGVFSAWVVLVMVQSGLVQAGRVAWHRTLGTASAVFGIVLPIVGVWVAIEVSRLRVQHGERGPESFLLVPLFDMAVFALLFGLAWWWRKRPELHRRLILLASVSLTVAAFARFPRSIVPGGHFNIACDMMIMLAVARDLVVDRRVHRVYLIALPLLFLGQAVTEWVRHTGWWLNVATRLLQ